MKNKTKADLQVEIASLQQELQRVQNKLQRRPLDTWIATAEEGTPVCIAAESEDFSVQVYTTEDGSLAVGVIVSEGPHTVFAAGVIPAKVFMQDLEWARRSA